MASRPSFPQPATFFTRMRLAADAIRGRLAQPTPTNPVADASPADEKAKPAVDQTYSRHPSGFAIDPRWLNQLALNPENLIGREGTYDLELFERVLDDPEVAAAFQQRRLALISRPWEVEPGDDSARAQEAADHLRLQLKSLPWDRICDRMLYGLWFGYGVGEGLYKIGPDGKYWLANVLVPDRKWFAFTNAGELRLKTDTQPEGEIVPPNKFWAYRSGGTNDFRIYGQGLAHWCYWPVWFKRNVTQFWVNYLEKFGTPTVLATFPAGADKTVIANIVEAAANVSSDTAVAIPDNAGLELLASGRQSNDSYQQFLDQMDDYIRRVVLGQTGTSKSEAQGLGGSQADVQKDVRDELVRSDSDLLHESFNQTFPVWLTLWNFGPGVAPPRLYRNLEDQEDLDSIVERDVKLKSLGWVRTEESVKEVYGDCYERAPEPEPIALPDRSGQAPGGNVVPFKRGAAQFAAMDPEPLYVRRDVLPATGRKLLAWAKEQGIPNLEPLGELHVTVLYSKAPVDWFDMSADEWGPDGLTVTAGGPRKIVKLGDKGAIVLQFASRRLKYRHEEMVERGASHDFDEYLPHVTLAYAPDFDPETITEAFNGELQFGPEIFEKLDTEWVTRLAASAFSADELDRIDRWAAELVNGTDPAITQFIAELKPKVRGITDPDALRVVLLDALERFPAEQIGEAAGLPFVAARASAAAGVE